MPNSYIASDEIEVGFGNKIALWLFGFLYWGAAGGALAGICVVAGSAPGANVLAWDLFGIGLDMISNAGNGLIGAAP